MLIQKSARTQHLSNLLSKHSATQFILSQSQPRISQESAKARSQSENMPPLPGRCKRAPVLCQLLYVTPPLPWQALLAPWGAGAAWLGSAPQCVIARSAKFRPADCMGQPASASACSLTGWVSQSQPRISSGQPGFSKSAFPEWFVPPPDMSGTTVSFGFGVSDGITNETVRTAAIDIGEQQRARGACTLAREPAVGAPGSVFDARSSTVQRVNSNAARVNPSPSPSPPPHPLHTQRLSATHPPCPARPPWC